MFRLLELFDLQVKNGNDENKLSIQNKRGHAEAFASQQEESHPLSLPHSAVHKTRALFNQQARLTFNVAHRTCCIFWVCTFFKSLLLGRRLCS